MITANKSEIEVIDHIAEAINQSSFYLQRDNLAEKLIIDGNRKLPSNNILDYPEAYHIPGLNGNVHHTCIGFLTDDDKRRVIIPVEYKKGNKETPELQILQPHEKLPLFNWIHTESNPELPVILTSLIEFSDQAQRYNYYCNPDVAVWSSWYEYGDWIDKYDFSPLKDRHVYLLLEPSWDEESRKRSFYIGVKVLDHFIMNELSNINFVVCVEGGFEVFDQDNFLNKAILVFCEEDVPDIKK